MSGNFELRVLILAPGRDGELTCQFLTRAGLECAALEVERELDLELQRGVGAVVVAEEALTAGVQRTIKEFIEHQPPWSDLPILVVARHDDPNSRLAPLVRLRGVSVLSRPMSIGTTVSAVQSALAARARQYEVRELLRERDEAARRKDEFLAMLAHELRNPLGPIRFGAQALRIQLNGHAGEVADSVDMIERQVAHMSRLIEDLLDVSRLTRGRVSLKLRRVDLDQLVSTTAELRREDARRRQIALEVSTPGTPHWAKGDADRLTQVLDNLLDNALKFCQPGGHVTVGLEEVDGEAVVWVEDDGSGIEPELLPRMFDPFSQADLSLDRAKGGLGLGLSIVKSLVRLHGGQISAHSEGVGLGARFTFQLPLIDAPKEVSAMSGDTTRPEGLVQGLKVVVIEDNHDGAAMLRMLLKVQGHEAQVAHSGPEGIELVGRFRPDVLLCDIGLPGMNGYEVARALDATEFRPARMIAITGYGGPEDHQAALAAGFDAHLVKPVSHESLVTELNRVALSRN